MIDQYPSPNGVLTSLIWRKTMSGGETSLSGYDNASQALSYTPGQEQVYLNGILLVRGDDYTATNGTSITGLSALSASDFVQVNCYNNFSLASLPSTSITGEISNSQITSLATSKLTGTISNTQLAGSISNDKLANSSITINGSAVSLGGSTTIAGGSAQDDAPTSPTEGQLWLDTNGTLATTGFTEKATLTTTGDIYYASAASTPARLGIGSTGQILTVSGGAPAWATPSSGGFDLLSTTTLSGVSTTINIASGYKSLQIIGDKIYGSASNTSGGCYARFNNDSGSNYCFNFIRYIGGAGGATDGVGTTIGLAERLSSTNSLAYWTTFQLNAYAVDGTDTVPFFVISRAHSGSTATFFSSAGTYDNSAAISSITISSPNLETLYGKIYIYGAK